MDASLIITGAMTLLKPLLEKAGEGAAKTIGEKIAERSVERSFWQKVKRLFIIDEEAEVIEKIENKSIATPEEVALIEKKLTQKVNAEPQLGAELWSELHISSTNLFLAQQLLRSLQADKDKLKLLVEDRRLAGVNNEDQYELEIRRVVRRMEKDEQQFRQLVKDHAA